MSTNSPTLHPQAETASPSNSREDAITTTTSMSPVTGHDTAEAAMADHPESQQLQQQEASSSQVQTPARTEGATSPESVDGNTQHPVVNVAPVAATSTVAIAADNHQPTTLAPVAETTTPTKDMKSTPLSSPIEPSVASLSITLLLISGVRHQFTMEEAYLEQHSVKTQSGKESLKDPFEMSVWQLKECIWKDWKDEWDQRPASAMFIRLIHFGRMLEDRHLLKDCRLNQDSPNVVHMTVRPPEVGDDEMTQRSTKGGFGHSRESGSGGSTPSCRCVIL